MSFSVAYLFARAGYRVALFFRHWYGDGTRAILRQFFGALASLDRTFAVKITLEHFFEPLYRDYTITGRILGLIFRLLRVAVGSIIYAVVAAVFFAYFLIWVLIPPAIVVLIIRSAW